MGILLRRKEGSLKLTGMAKLSTLSLLVSFSSALIGSVWALYLDSFVHSAAIVGFVSSGLLFVGFISYFIFIPFIEKNSKSSIYRNSLLIIGLTYILFAINTKFYFFVILAVAITMLDTLRVTSFGIIVRDKSSKKNFSKNEGLLYTFMNLSWVIGPLIAGFVSEKYGVNVVFILASLFIFLSFLLFKISKIKDKNISKKIHGGILKNFKEFFKNKQRVLAYFLGGGVNLWWGLIYLFIPLFIIRSGLNNLWVGYFLFAIAVPLILVEFKCSDLADKKGYSKIFKIAYLMVAIISISCFFISNIYLILGLLVFASFGMAMLEPTTEVYFFKILKKKSDENRFYGPYNTAISSGAFVGRITASILLVFLAFNYLFLLYGLFMGLLFLLSFKVKKHF